MKVKLVLLLSVLLLAGTLPAQNPNVVVPYLLKAPAPVSVDCELDEWSFAFPMKLHPLGMRDYMRAVDEGWVVEDPDNCNGTLYAMYDDNYFYFAAVVTDDAPGHFSEAEWAADAIEFYFGNWDVGDALIGAPEVAGWIDDDEGNYCLQINVQFDESEDIIKIIGYNGPQSAIESSDTEAKYLVTDTGYILEGKIFLEDLVSVNSGNEMSFTGGTRIPWAVSLYDVDETESSGDFKGLTYTPAGFPGWQGVSPGWQVCDVMETARGDAWADGGEFDFVPPYIKKTADKPIIDGFLDDWFFAFPVDFNPDVMEDGMRAVADGWAMDDWDNCSGTLYMMYDDEYLYVAANVRDDMPGHFSEAEWAADAIEFYMANWDIGDALMAGPDGGPMLDDDEGNYSIQLNLQFDASEEAKRVLGYGGPQSPIESGDTEMEYRLWDDEDGYVIEAKIFLEDLVSLNTGNEMMFTEGTRLPFTWSLYDMDDTENSGDFKGYAYSKANFPAWQGPGPGWQYADVKGLDFVDDWEANGPYPQANSVAAESTQPDGFALSNYPNPFNPSTSLQFDLADAGNVTLQIYDVNGKLIHTALNNDHRSAGNHVVNVDMSSQPSGVYVAVIHQSDRKQTHKMMLVK